MANSDSIKLCECGCGKPTPIAKKTRPERGQTKGLPIRYCRGHSGAHKSHGLVSTPTYKNWAHMLERCSNPNHRKWHRYGGRGISVCRRWTNFENFLADMGPRLPGTSIERIDNNGNYEPGNCKWASAREQSQNTSNNVFIEHAGQRRCLSEWERVLGLYRGALSWRLKNGFSLPELFYKRPPRTSRSAS